MVMSRRIAAVLAALAAAGPPLASAGEAAPALAPLAEGETGWVLRCAKVLTIDGEDRVLDPGTVIVRNGKIAAVGEDLAAPEGFEVLEFPTAWAIPGLVEIHSHVHTGGWGDINDMVRTVNPELRASATIRPSNELIRRACSAGVTTIFGIPGSGTAISGFGVLFKAKTSGTYDEIISAERGAMKVAQTHNPERGAGDLGSTRAALSWILADVNDRALAAAEQGRFDLALEDLKRVHAQELPVLVHCAGNDGVANTVRTWAIRYDTHAFVSHGSFDGWYAGRFAAEHGVPVNHGPRTMNWRSGQVEGRIVSSAAEYVRAGVPNFSLCTDASVMPQEELFLQGAVSARLGADPYLMLRAVTIHPARTFGIDDRVGSLEAGKDADVVIYSGSPLDPRSRVELVLIDGRVQYDRKHDGQWF